MLFPISEASEEHRRLEAEREQLADPKLYYMKQVVGNACGNYIIFTQVYSLEGDLLKTLRNYRYLARGYEFSSSWNGATSRQFFRAHVS